MVAKSGFSLAQLSSSRMTALTRGITALNIRSASADCIWPPSDWRITFCIAGKVCE